jgi:hypothetical protein
LFVDFFKQVISQSYATNVVSKIADGGLIWSSISDIHAEKDLERDPIIDLGFSLRVRQVEPLLHEEYLKHKDRVIGRSSGIRGVKVGKFLPYWLPIEQLVNTVTSLFYLSTY